MRIMRASDLRSRTSLSAAAPAEMSAMPARVSSIPMWKLGMPERTEPEIEAGPGGDDDQQGDARLEELHVVGEQVGGGLGAAVRLRLLAWIPGRESRRLPRTRQE